VKQLFVAIGKKFVFVERLVDFCVPFSKQVTQEPTTAGRRSISGTPSDPEAKQGMLLGQFLWQHAGGGGASSP
jgi:hypothetical protein